MKLVSILLLMFSLLACTIQKEVGEDGSSQSIMKDKPKYKFDTHLIGSWVKSLYATQGIRINEDGTMGTYLVSEPDKFGLNTLAVYIETFERNKEKYMVSHAYNEKGEEVFSKEVKYKVEKDTLFLPSTIVDQESGVETTIEFGEKYFRVAP